jgi:eukaryotic-like serine/threonine-protein kinase
MPEPTPESVERLFQQAADVDPARRGAFLDEQCAGDLDLRAAVEELLQFDAAAQSSPDFLQSPAADVVAGLPTAWAVPEFIGRYRILRRHAEGGMGTVYEAEQDNPRRTVALKVIRPGLVSPELVKRFSHEAQILGRLQHSGIAQVYEAGMGEDGQPFFAMEFIRGTPLDEYARSRGLNAAARLELLARVCDAVQHAHDKGVIHRDLKPSNILVDETGQPKVLDFGVAHVTAADLLTSASRTQAGQLLGTMSYMSPEQIAADAAGLDGRSDVYTLGVILFELLAYRLPYQLEKLPMHEVARLIQQQEPSRLGSIDALYRGDVEIIVGKTLEKDKTRRYASAGDLASDIRRYLRGEPIVARPASALYQLRKFAVRHTALVAGTSGVFAALLVGAVVSIVFALRAADNARVANQRERDATYESYRARIAAAVAALSHHDVVDAARQLDATPKALRDWEWKHLRTRLDDSATMLPAAAGETHYLIRDSQSVRIAALTRSRLRITDLEGNELMNRAFRREKDLTSDALIPMRHGLRLATSGRQSRARVPVVALFPDASTNVVDLLADDRRGLNPLKGPAGMKAEMAAVSPDSSRLAVCWAGHEQWRFTVYESESDKPGVTSAQDIGDTWDLAFDPNGRRLATAGEDGRARLWDTSTGILTAECRGHTRKVVGVAFRPDGQRLATTSADGTVRQWDASTGQEVEAPYDRHIGDVLTAAYSPDGQSIASGGADRTIRIWLASTRHDVAVLHGHTGVVTDLAFTADGGRLASTSQWGRYNSTYDRTVRLWEISQHASSSVLRGHTSYIYPVAYSPDGQWIASGGWDNTVRLWNAVTGESCATLPHPGIVRALAFSPDSSWLVSACHADEGLQVWNFTARQLQKTFRRPGSIVAAAVAISPDGAHIAAADADGTVKIVEAATGAEVHSFRKASAEVTQPLAFSPDGRFLASLGEDGAEVDLWDTLQRRRSARLAGHTGSVHSVAFSRDGLRLATASADNTVRVWDLAAARCVTVLKGHTDSVFTAVFHPDGNRLASAGRDRAVWIWDLATGQEVARLDGHTEYVFSLAFSPDGRCLASGSGDGTVRLWDTEQPTQRHRARREAEALRPEAERLVARLFAELHDPTDVVARLRSDASLSDPLRHAAVREVLRRGAASKTVRARP